MPVKEEGKDDLTIGNPDGKVYRSSFVCAPISCCQEEERYIDDRWQLFRNKPVKAEMATVTIKEDGFLSSYVFPEGKAFPNPETEHVKCSINQTCTNVSDTLAKVEMDVAEALTELACIVNVRTQSKSIFGWGNRGLQWFRKRKRSRRLSKDAVFLTVKGDMVTNAKPHRLLNEAVDLDGPETTGCAKRICPCSSRAESPSSPLECQNFSVRSCSARHAVLKPGPVKHLHKGHPQLHEDQGLEASSYGLATTRSKLIARRKPKALSLTVKVEEEVHTTVGKEYTYYDLSSVDFKTEKLVKESGDVDYHIANKHRAQLSEVEKEARRLRRVQANRESARLTIKRKQILCEDLKRRAACLAVENRGLIQKKKFLMQELDLLKDQNDVLKQQLAGDLHGIIGTEPTVQTCKLPLQSFGLPGLPIPGLPSSQQAGRAASIVKVHNYGTSGCDAIHETCSDGMSSISEEPSRLSSSTVAPLSSQEVVVGGKQSLQSFVRGIGDCKRPLFQTVDYQVPSGVLSQASTTSALQSSGYSTPMNGTQAEAPFDGSLHNFYMFTTRTSSAVVLAAEARRRRKELTRRKFLQSRAFRPRR